VRLTSDPSFAKILNAFSLLWAVNRCDLGVEMSLSELAGLRLHFYTWTSDVESEPNWSAVGSAQQNQLSVRRGGRGRIDLG
jgi:hypothetical protein